ncbi:MAG: HD domain-containing protein [Planctomycetaceae bacterium]
MISDKLRQQIVFEAARLLYQRQESDFARARIQAARRISRRYWRTDELPTDREIRDELLRLTSIYGFGTPPANDGSDPEFPSVESADELKKAKAAYNSDGLFAPSTVAEEPVDRFDLYRALLVPLSRVRQHRDRHPEGDVLYHSLQVFELGRDALPYDEEFLIAALLHDVGKGLDPKDHVEAGLQALDGYISERTEWLIRHHSEAHSILDGKIGVRARRRLAHSESFDELMLLCECDRAGRQPGMKVSEVDDALDYIRELDAESA